MKNLKKLPTKQLEKFSNIFTQLGLVLVLFIVYITLEHETEQNQYQASNLADITETIVLEPDQILQFTRVQKKQPKIKISKNDVFLIDEPNKEVDNRHKESVIVNEVKKDIVAFDNDKVYVVDEPVDVIIEDVPYDFIQEAPVFKGCEGLSKEENKKCFDKKMKRFVQRNFDADLASEVGLNSGKYKIQTQFVIDDKGNVIDIKIRAPHTKLKKETLQLIEKLPKFTPGKQNDKNVRVRYTLPISFQVD